METLSKDANFKPLSLLTQKPTVDKIYNIENCLW